MPSSFLNNLVPWLLQVSIIGCVGAVLPLVFRIRHPRSQMMYCQFLLLACVVLPFVQRWHPPVIQGESTTSANSPAIGSAPGQAHPSAQPAGLPWNSMLLWVLAAGTVVRFGWTLAGLWQLRRYRNAATPLYPVPESVKAAQRLIKADAEVCTTLAGVGPLTFGFFRRVILLPQSFLALDEEAQLGIACHELLHVQRNDWAITLVEELIGSIFWFHPAIWWVLGQTRLAREQLVDAGVVRLTAGREPYIQALLSIAGESPKLDLAPAPLFLRRRHLLQRMHFLLSEVPMSRMRLVASYASMAAILVLAGSMVFVSFPMVGQAEIKPVPPQAQSNAPQPGYVVNVPPAYYPPDALAKKIEGSVVVELTFNANGDITDSRVLSGPEELRKGGLESALRGSYNINVVRTLQVVVNFKIPPPPVPGQRGNFRSVGAPDGGGARGGAPVPPVLPPSSTEFVPAFVRSPGVLESINIVGLEGAELAQMQQRLSAFQGKPMSPDLFREINQAIRGINLSVALRSTSTAATASNNTALLVTFGATPPAAAAPPTPQRVRIGGNVAARNLIRSVDAVYPPLAKQARIQGVVVLEVSITKEGTVDNVVVVTGHPLLTQAAVDAVTQWEYAPVQLNGSPVDVVTTVSVNFSLAGQ